MSTKGYTLGYSSGDTAKYSSSNIPILPLVGGSDLSHQCVINQIGFSTDWRKHPRISNIRKLIRSKIAEIFSISINCGQVQRAFDIATTLEHQLFIDAASEEEYVNQERLIQRLQTKLHNNLHGIKNSGQVDRFMTSSSMTMQSSGLLHDCYIKSPAGAAAFQNLEDVSISSTDYCIATENSTCKYGDPKGGLSHPFITHETVFSPDESSSITTCTDIDGFSNFGGFSNVETSSKSIGSHFQHQHMDDEFSDSICAARHYGEQFGTSEGMLQPTKRQKLEPAFGVSAINNGISDPWAPKEAKPHFLEGHSELQQQSESFLSIYSEVTENNMEPFTTPMLDSTSISKMGNSLVDDKFEWTFKSETILSEDVEGRHTTEALHLKNHGTIDGNLKERISRSNFSRPPLPSNPSADIEEELQNQTGFGQTGKETKEKDIGPKADLEKEAKFSNPKANAISMAENFTYDQIREHIMSLQQQFDQSAFEGERGIDVNSCQLCANIKLVFTPVPIYCLSCGSHIKRNAYYYCQRAEEFDTEYCFCTSCHRASRGDNITFNGISIAKTMLDRKRNNELIEEGWVQCDKCERWQHQICALFNNNRDLEGNAEYVCPRCCIEEINDGLQMPLLESDAFGAEDLPRTLLSDHIEQRLFKRLKQERVDRAKVEGKNVDEVSVAENLAVRVVLSVDKQLKVKEQFLDIFCEANYPAEFPYRSKVILLFQKIEGVHVCLFGMYVQEYGTECGYPNQRSMYISYLDSVKYFRPQRHTMTGEALRTFVYHEILIGYLDFCKTQGFTTCYIWACPPVKGEDYVLYRHPEAQKTPKNDKLRKWYHSMLRKAAKENIVVGFTNIYDRFFVPGGKTDSKVTAAHLPYFDGDYWSGAAMDLVRSIEQGNRREYQKKVKKIMTKRTLKAMGRTNPSEGIAKDILVMQKLGQTILPVKEDFMVVSLQYACTECQELIISGKRWFCCECKDFQLCERCHTADIHTSISRQKHTLCQVVVDAVPFDTRENDIVLDNDLFENRHNFLSFCQKNHFQFDTLRRAKHSSMMILYHLKNHTLLPAGKKCNICCQDTVFQQSWQCETCPQFTVCSACYRQRGASCHTHRLSQCASTALCQRRNEEIKRKSALTRKLLEVLKHASQCHSTRNQPCSYPNCLQIKKLFCHASSCTVRTAGGCQHCKKAWLGLSMHSRNCRDSKCLIPRCMDLKKHAEWIAQQSESRRRAAVKGVSLL